MTDNSRGRSLTTSEKEAYAALQGLIAMGLLPKTPYDYHDPGKVETADVELDNEKRYITKIKKRIVKFEWRPYPKAKISLKNECIYYLDGGVLDREEEDGRWWNVESVEIEVADPNIQDRPEYSEFRLGKIKFEGRAAAKLIENEIHRSRYPGILY